MKIILVTAIFILTSCASVPKEEKIYCVDVFDKETKKESTLCMKENQRDKLLYGDPKPKRRHTSKMGNY